MNVIIVSKFLKTPRKLCLREPRIAALVFTAMLLLLGIGAATGYGIRAGIAGDSTQDIEALRLQIKQQQQAFESQRTG